MLSKKKVITFIPPPPVSLQDVGSTPALSVHGDIVLYSLNFQMHLRGGTFEGLINRLITNRNFEGEEEVEIFLFGYRNLEKASNVLTMIFKCWDTVKSEDSEANSAELIKYARNKIIHILKTWATTYPSDFDIALVKKIVNWIKKISKNFKEYAESLNNLKKIIEGDKVTVTYQTSSELCPPSKEPQKNSFEFFDDAEIARQLALSYQRLIRNIPTEELINKQFFESPQTCPILSELIGFSEKIREWVASEICKRESKKERVKFMKKICLICKECLNINNFAGCYNLWAGFCDLSVWRLKSTWSKLEKDKVYWEVLNILRSQLDYPSNFTQYRKALPTDRPCIPSIGITLQDLVCVEIMEPDYIEIDRRQDIVNFLKFQKQFYIVHNFIEYSKLSYNFKKVKTIYEFFLNLQNLSAQDRFVASKKLESKESNPPRPEELKAIEPMPLRGPTSVEKEYVSNGLKIKPQEHRDFFFQVNKTPRFKLDKSKFIVNSPPDKKKREDLLLASGISVIESGGIDEKARQRQKDLQESIDVITGGLVFYSKNMLQFLKGGKMENILDHLLRDNCYEEEILAFLLGYRKYVSLKELITQLDKQWPKDTSDDTPNILKQSYLAKKNNVGKMVKLWLTHHFNDFAYDSESLKLLRAFLSETVYQDPNSVHAKQITDQIKSSIQNIKDSQAKKGEDDSTDDEGSDWMLFDVTSISEQISLYEQSLFLAIKQNEWVFSNWKSSPETCPNLIKWINFAQSVSAKVATEVISTKGERQIELILRYMMLSLKCRQLRNFNTCHTVSFALNKLNNKQMSSVWEKISQIENQLYESFLHLIKVEFNPDNNFYEYKKILKDDYESPTIPYIAVYLTDLELIASSSSDYLTVESGETDVINFKHLIDQFAIIKEISLNQKRPKYKFEVNTKIRSFFVHELNSLYINMKKKVEQDDSEEKKSNSHQEADVPVPGEPLEPSWENFPQDVLKKVKKLKIATEDLKNNVVILWNVCEFLHPSSFPKQPKNKRIPYASKEMRDDAAKEIVVADKSKKLYKNISFQGSGGFASVFSAKDLTSKRQPTVAIKKLPHETPKQIQTNLCEIAFLMASKDQANIVQYNRTFLIEKELWIEEEYLHGGTLQVAARTHRFSDKHNAFVARELLRAMSYLHSKGFVHRDLKSQNVMMSVDGFIKLIDFGLCADFNDGPRVSIVGSPFWIPPEMIRKEPHSYPSDIWSMGVCLLELYLMAPPHCISSIKCMFLVGTVGLADQIPSTATDEARSFLSKCLETDQTKRSKAEDLLKEPWVCQQGLDSGLKEVLKDIFLSDTLHALGF